MKVKTVFTFTLILLFSILAYIEYQDFGFRQVTWSFVSQNWISLLGFVFSSLSLWIAIRTYRLETQARIKIVTSAVWDFDLEEETLENGDTTAVITTRIGTRIDRSVENTGGRATTLKSLEIVKRDLLRGSKKAEIEWRRDFILTRTDENGALVRLSIWNQIEPGQRVNLLLPYIDLLDIMVTHNMLDPNSSSQGKFNLIIKHVYGEAKSSAFRIVLSESVRTLIRERVQAFGRIIVRNRREEDETDEI